MMHHYRVVLPVRLQKRRFTALHDSGHAILSASRPHVQGAVGEASGMRTIVSGGGSAQPRQPYSTFCSAPGIVVKRVDKGDGVSSVRWLAQALDGASSRQRPQVLMRLYAPASRPALARGGQPKPRR